MAKKVKKEPAPSLIDMIYEKGYQAGYKAGLTKGKQLMSCWIEQVIAGKSIEELAKEQNENEKNRTNKGAI